MKFTIHRKVYKQYIIYPKSGGIAPTTAPTHVFTWWICFKGVYKNAYRTRLEAASPAANILVWNNLVINFQCKSLHSKHIKHLIRKPFIVLQVTQEKHTTNNVSKVCFKTCVASRAVPANPTEDAQPIAWGFVIRPEGSGLPLVLFILASLLISNT